MQAVRTIDPCQEARFALWALRCAVAEIRGDLHAAAELVYGFDLADVTETTPAFRGLIAALCVPQWAPTVWHHPRCCCMSTEEVLMLRALADAAERQRRGDAAPGPWWRLFVPAANIEMLDLAARSWLAALDRAGVVFPLSANVAESLRLLDNMTGPAPAWLN